MFLVRCIFVLLAFHCSIVFAEQYDYAYYASDAGRLMGVNSCIILGVIKQEGGTVGKDTHHVNGSIDTGLAQINKNGDWMRLFEHEFGINHRMLRDNPYISILSVSYILKMELERSNGDMIDAIAAYHRGFGNRRTMKGLDYASKVLSHARQYARKGMC